MGEKHLQLQCDNCPGQNKNNTMLQYLLWRVLHGFGLVKQTYQRKMVSCLDDIVEAVRSSTQTGVNNAQLVGRENGEVFVEQRDWQSFLKPFFQTFPCIAQHQHYRCVIW